MNFSGRHAPPLAFFVLVYRIVFFPIEDRQALWHGAVSLLEAILVDDFEYFRGPINQQ